MFRNLLVPLDGSELAEHALPVAVEVARRSAAGLELAHVRCAPIATGEGTNATQAAEPAAGNEQEYLEAVRANTSNGVAVTVALLDGPAIAPALCAEVTRRGVDLIVMTTHGRGGLARAWLGSVADRMVREAEVPVLLVRPGGDAPGMQPPELFRRILVPLEECSRIETILEPARALGGLSDATYTLLHVITPTTSSGHYRDRRERAEQEAIEESRATAQLRRAAARVQLGAEQATTMVVRHRSPAWAILERAAEGYDLIALATHGYGPVGRFLLGSVADKVLRGATIPVLVCRASRRRAGEW
jgi:nucleotide-binding universal stress UspA family protein